MLCYAMPCHAMLCILRLHECTLPRPLCSYAVAVKRCGILFSVLSGRVFFGEPIGTRLPYILLMLMGGLMILLDPSRNEVHPH